MSSSNMRPRTTKPRGICMYYSTPRGCFAGSSCKFLHGVAEQLDPQDPLLTPYDESKRCRFYTQGFCRRGDQCWFKHVPDEHESGRRRELIGEEDLQNEPCSICFEKPVTYGLLSGCSHIFCITCIRQWRDQKGQLEHGNMKKCPMCREPSRFITPSSRFWKHGHPEKDRVTKAYKNSMAKIPCRYFLQSVEKDRSRPLCPFGRDCFYQHLKDDGTPYVFRTGTDVCMRQYFIAMRPYVRSIFDELIDFTSELQMSVNGPRPSDGTGIFSMQITADMDSMVPEDSNSLTGNDQSRGSNLLREDPHIRRQLHILREAMDSLESAVSASNDSVARTLDMVRILVQQNTDPGPHPNSATERPEAHASEEGQAVPDLFQDVPTLSVPSTSQPSRDDLLVDDVDYYDMAGLQSVSNSSPSEAHLSDSDSDSDDVSRLGRYLRSAASTRFGELPDQLEVQHGEDEEARMMQEIAERGPEIIDASPALVADADEPQMPVMAYESLTLEDEVDHGRVTNPPFLTDGRGRVVWSSERETGETANSQPCPSAEMEGGTASGGELQTKRNGRG